MKKLIFILTLFSISIGQDKMILKSGEEITLSKKNILDYYNSNYEIIKNDNKIYQKKHIAKIINEDIVIVFRAECLYRIIILCYYLTKLKLMQKQAPKILKILITSS